MVDPALWWQFRPGQRVFTREGLAGVVQDVQDGPVAGYETYLVVLDGGMGGGQYASSDLSPTTGATGSVQHTPSHPATPPQDADDRDLGQTAAHWYPELGTVLSDRPPPPLSVAAGRTAGHYADTSASLALSEAASDLLTAANDWAWQPDYPGEPRPLSGTGEVRQVPPPPGADLPVEAGTAEPGDGADTCICCGGTGEHRTGQECYRCDASGQESAASSRDPVPCEATAGDTGTGKPACPQCGVPITYDQQDGWQHADGSINHWDGSPGTVPEALRANAGWVKDLLTPPTQETSFDWCRWRRSNDCWYPQSLNQQASAQAGYAVWDPVDRGRCPRVTWPQQQVCPLGEPGPNAHGYVDATVPWDEGGQRGGVPTPGYRAPVTGSLRILDSERAGGEDRSMTYFADRPRATDPKNFRVEIEHPNGIKLNQSFGSPDVARRWAKNSYAAGAIKARVVRRTDGAVIFDPHSDIDLDHTEWYGKESAESPQHVPSMARLHEAAEQTGWAHEVDPVQGTTTFRLGRDYLRVRHDVRGRFRSAGSPKRRHSLDDAVAYLARPSRSTKTAGGLSFSCTQPGRYHSRGQAHSYVVVRDGRGWKLNVFAGDDPAPTYSSHDDTLSLAQAVAAHHEALGEDYRQHEHGGRSRLTEAIGRAYDQDRTTR